MSLIMVGWLGVAFAVASYIKPFQEQALPLSFAAYTLLIYQCWHLGAFNLIALYVFGFIWNTIAILALMNETEDGE